MSGDREVILANFQGCTGIENVEEAISWLEGANWDLLTAIKNAIPQETQNQSNILMYGGGDSKKARTNGTPINVTSDFDASPSTSEIPRILEIHVHHLTNIYKLQVPEAMTVGCIKTVIYTDTRIQPSQQLLTGWPILPTSDDAVLSKLNMPNVTHLYLTPNLNPGERNRVTDMDVVDESAENWQSSSSSQEPHDDNENDSKKQGISSKAGEQQENSSGERRSRSGRLVKRFKRDYSKMLFDLKIYDEVNNKDYTIKVPGCKTVGQVKKDAVGLTDIPLRQQVWCGWPDNVTDFTKLSDLDLDQPFHCLILQSCGENSQQFNNISGPNVIVERLPSPIFIDLAGDTDSSPEDFEDASESFVGEDEIFSEEVVSTRNRNAPLIPDNVEDETAGSVHFIDAYAHRYGQTSPNFFPGTLEDAMKEACFRAARQRRMLAIYLHHDGSVLSNVFCTELLGFETVLQTFANYFVIWGWDITNRGNREMFLNSVSRLLGGTVTETVQSISPELLPALMIVSRSRSNTELLNVIYGNIGLNELLTMLIHAVDVFTDMQETEIKDEEERAARERIKVEQDKAYQESLQIDRAKEEAKKQQQLLQSQEEERIKREQIIEEEKRKAERLAAESQLTDEPTGNTPSSQIMTFRFRPPTGDIFTRKFFVSDTLKIVFNYLLVKGYRMDEYKLISPWPTRKDLSALDENSVLKDLGLCYQETIILEER